MNEQLLAIKAVKKNVAVWKFRRSSSAKCWVQLDSTSCLRLPFSFRYLKVSFSTFSKTTLLQRELFNSVVEDSTALALVHILTIAPKICYWTATSEKQQQQQQSLNIKKNSKLLKEKQKIEFVQSLPTTQSRVGRHSGGFTDTIKLQQRRNLRLKIYNFHKQRRGGKNIWWKLVPLAMQKILWAAENYPKKRHNINERRLVQGGTKMELKVILCSYMNNFQSSLCVYFETSFKFFLPFFFSETRKSCNVSLSDVGAHLRCSAIQSRVQIVRSLSLFAFFHNILYAERCIYEVLHLLFNECAFHDLQYRNKQRHVVVQTHKRDFLLQRQERY